MPLHPENAALLAILAEHRLPPGERTVAAMRSRDIALSRRLAGDAPALAETRDLLAGLGGDRVPVRLYRPRADSALPMLIWLHGGGFTTGGVDTVDTLCRRLAAGANCLLLSVDYRLAPEHKHPAALDDTLVVLAWCLARGTAIDGDPMRVAIGGTSAGANLAAAAALAARAHGWPLVLQLLVYPPLDATMASPTIDSLGSGYQFTSEQLRWSWANYVPDNADRRDPAISPLFAASLQGVAPVLMILAGYDPLRGEGDAYARRLVDAGVPCRVSLYAEHMHAFFGYAGVLAAAQAAQAEACAALRAAFAGRDALCDWVRAQES